MTNLIDSVPKGNLRSRNIPDCSKSLSGSQGPYYDAETANKLLDEFRIKAATLETALKIATRFCHLRKSGFCYADCKASILCEAEDMKILTWADLPESFKELVYVR